jgi:hypothetical protein
MKRPLLVLLFLPFLYVIAGLQADAQRWNARRWEASAGLGTSFFFGDVGGFSQGENALGFKDLTWLQTRASGNLSLRFRVIEEANLRLSLSGANLRATDRRGDNINRGYNARTIIFEPALLGEFYFIKNNAENSYLFSRGRGSALRNFLSSLDFYTFTGFGMAFCNVQADESFYERPEFSKTGSIIAPVIPVGLGATMIYSPEFNFGLELGGRYSFSDYIDGYSNPQFSKARDVYYFLNFTFTYKMSTNQNGVPVFITKMFRRRR